MCHDTRVNRQVRILKNDLRGDLIKVEVFLSDDVLCHQAEEHDTETSLHDTRFKSQRVVFIQTTIH